MAWLERRFGATVQWLSFDLHPEYPPEGIPRAVLERRYGSDFSAGVRRMIEESDLQVSAELHHVPNARKALIVGELARDHGSLNAVKDALFRAYWADARDIGDVEVLVGVAAEHGLAEAEVREAIAGERALDRIQASTSAAIELGATGVPAFVFDDRVLVPGAQPHEVLERVVRRLGHEPVVA